MMLRRTARTLHVLCLFALAGCAAPQSSPPLQRVQSEMVPAGKLYKGGYINITSPRSDGWGLLESSPGGMAFARASGLPDESLVAAVKMFDLPSTDSAESFERLIVEQATRESQPERFTSNELTRQYTEARGYPCVEIHNVSTDKQAAVSATDTKQLRLENFHLYCRHPVRTETGFLVSYSHRGANQYSGLKDEAAEFWNGVVVPTGK